MTLYHVREHRRSRIPGLIDPYVLGIPWYLASGIPPGNCRAAYQAKGAVSYTESKINLASPGTYNLTDGSAPFWSAATGWTFSSSYLYSTLSIDQKPATYIARLKTVGLTGGTIIGGNTASMGLSFDLDNATNIPRLLKQDILLIGAGASGFPAATDTTIAVTYSASGAWAHYLNGSANGTGINNQTPSSNPMRIGSQYNGQIYYGDIMGIAIYNVALTATQVAAVSAELASL